MSDLKVQTCEHQTARAFGRRLRGVRRSWVPHDRRGDGRAASGEPGRVHAPCGPADRERRRLRDMPRLRPAHDTARLRITDRVDEQRAIAVLRCVRMTRADFYVGRGAKAKWLGSVACDGYPTAQEGVCKATTLRAYRKAVFDSLGEAGEYATLPQHGWPWPWEDSKTSDYAYAFEKGKVYFSSFGHSWQDATLPEPDEDDEGYVESPRDAVFPNMKDKRNVTFGKRSGLIVMQAPK